jgi:intracellular sulfur oxidation DsrE/DsrF family protein
MLQESSVVKNNLEKLQQRGVTFLVCRNTLNEKKIDPKTLLPIAHIIQAGLAHVITRQSEGWSYIKAGF